MCRLEQLGERSMRLEDETGGADWSSGERSSGGGRSAHLSPQYAGVRICPLPAYARRGEQLAGGEELEDLGPGRRRDCHSAAPPLYL